jgi:hypothetical protein
VIFRKNVILRCLAKRGLEGRTAVGPRLPA